MKRLFTSLISGPGIVESLFESKVFKKKDLETKIMPATWHGYHLDKNFQSKNGMPFNSNTIDCLAKMNGQLGDYCDISWCDEGKVKVKEREKQLHESASKIQQWYRFHKSKTIVENTPNDITETYQRKYHH